jgi:hypothetical protein
MYNQKYDENIIKWSGFFKTESDAENNLQENVRIYAQKKLILTAKKELTIGKSHDMLLFKFTIITASK